MARYLRWAQDLVLGVAAWLHNRKAFPPLCAMLKPVGCEPEDQPLTHNGNFTREDELGEGDLQQVGVRGKLTMQSKAKNHGDDFTCIICSLFKHLPV